MLQQFGPSLYSTEGPAISFFGFVYPTRMAAARLADGSLWVWSPVALTDGLAAEVRTLGPVRYIVAPNALHHLFLHEWARRWPDALLYAPPGLARKKPALHFAAELGEEPDPAWLGDIDQAVFRGSIALREVVFFHRPSRTAIFGDLIQRFPAAQARGWRGALMRLDGLVGEHGSTPREWRASFLRRSAARAARAKVLAWSAERLLIAHGACVDRGAAATIESALAWI